MTKVWDAVNRKNTFKLEFDARTHALRQYRQRLKIMLDWEEHMRNLEGNQQDIARLKNLKNDILELLEKNQS